MKYFTFEWWNGESASDPDPVTAYQKHMASILDRLPSGFKDLEKSISLHDSKVRTVAVDVVNATIEVVLDGYQYHQKTPATHCEITMRYGQVKAFASSADYSRKLGGPGGYGDLGYDEIDILADGTFEHRILFSTGIEWTIQFGVFAIEQHTVIPPRIIDNMTVVYWAWSWPNPFFVMPEGRNGIAIHGFAVGKSSDGKSYLRLSCNRQWESQNDADYDSLEAALTATVNGIDFKQLKWQTLNATNPA